MKIKVTFLILIALLNAACQSNKTHAYTNEELDQWYQEFLADRLYKIPERAFWIKENNPKGLLVKAARLYSKNQFDEARKLYLSALSHGSTSRLDKVKIISHLFSMTILDLNTQALREAISDKNNLSQISGISSVEVHNSLLFNEELLKSNKKRSSIKIDDLTTKQKILNIMTEVKLSDYIAMHSLYYAMPYKGLDKSYYCLLDTGSTSMLMSEDLAMELNVNENKVTGFLAKTTKGVAPLSFFL